MSYFTLDCLYWIDAKSYSGQKFLEIPLPGVTTRLTRRAAGLLLENLMASPLLRDARLPIDMSCMALEGCQNPLALKGDRLGDIIDRGIFRIRGVEFMEDDSTMMLAYLLAVHCPRTKCKLETDLLMSEFIVTELRPYVPVDRCSNCHVQFDDTDTPLLDCHDHCGMDFYCSPACQIDHRSFHDDWLERQQAVASAMRTCHACHHSGVKLPKCSRCETVYYCNSECQLGDWQRHKSGCIKKPKRKET